MICNEDGEKKKKIHWRYDPVYSLEARTFDFAGVARNTTPTPRSPLADASLIKILVLYCSTLINVRNYALVTRHQPLYVAYVPVTPRCHLSNICKQKMVIDNGRSKMNGFLYTCMCKVACMSNDERDYYEIMHA